MSSPLTEGKTRANVKRQEGNTTRPIAPPPMKPSMSKRDYVQLFKKLVESNNYELMGGYINSRTKVGLKCPEGHMWNVTPNSFNRGVRCVKCANMCPEQAKERFIGFVGREGFELLDEYRTIMTKVKLRCPEGHEWEVTPNNFNNGSRCPKCTNNCPIQAKERFERLVGQDGFELLDEYVNSNTKVELVCPNEHKWVVSPNRFQQGDRCPHCQGSAGQRKLQDMLLGDISDDVVYNDRMLLHGWEVDIYYPTLKIAIEYQGNYWHNKPEVVERDNIKKRMCESYGIDLIEVWDVEFMDNPDKVYKSIKEFIINKKVIICQTKMK